MQIPIDKIVPNPEQPRRVFDEDEMAQLAASIKARGVIQPIVVEEGADGVYVLHDGERRWRASILAGRYVVPAVVTPSLNGGGGRDRLLRALVANVQRADLNPIEIAVSLKRLRDENVWSNRRIAEETGLPISQIPNYLRLLDLDEEIQDLIVHGELPKDPRVVKAFLSIEDSATRVAFAQRVARQGVTIKAIEAGAQRLRDRLSNPAPNLPDAALTPAPNPEALRAARLPAKERKQAVTVARVEEAVQPDESPRWANVRAATRGICAACDIRPVTFDEPAWSLVLDSADATCKACSVGGLKELDLCRQCPAVGLLKRMAGVR